jgi:hypothetical protein
MPDDPRHARAAHRLARDGGGTADALRHCDDRLRLNCLAGEALFDCTPHLSRQPSGDLDAAGKRHADRAVTADCLLRKGNAMRAGNDPVGWR